METEKKSNEINLLDIFISIWNGIVKFIKWIFGLIGKIFQLLFRNIAITLTFVIIGFAISQYFARSSNKQYEMSAMAKLYGISADDVKEIGRQLTLPSKKHDLSSIADKLKLPNEVADKLIKVDFYDVIDYQKDNTPDEIDFKGTYSPSDTTAVKMRDLLYMKVRLVGTDKAEIIGDAIINFLNNNPVVKKDFESYKIMLEQKIKITNDELMRLDSLARTKYFDFKNQQLQIKDNQLIIGKQDTQLFWYEMIKLEKIRSESQKSYALASSPIILPAGFVLNPKAVNGRVEYAIIGILIGLLFALVIGFIKENYKKAIDFLRRK